MTDSIHAKDIITNLIGNLIIYHRVNSMFLNVCIMFIFYSLSKASFGVIENVTLIAPPLDSSNCLLV